MASRILSQSLLRLAARPTTAMAAARRATTTPFLSSSPAAAIAAATRPSLHPSLILRRLLSDDMRKSIDNAVASAPVVLFMKGTPETPQCGFSRASIQILSMQGVDPAKFAAFNVLEDPSLREGIKEYSEWPTIPQLYVDKEFIGGCDILVSMHQNGDLARMLAEKGVLAPTTTTTSSESESDSESSSKS